ncbi:MAG: helicase-related protein [Nitrososphaerales archaeon]
MGSVEHPLVWSDTIEGREYQERIASTASSKNTLVILPTALGKTVISALVAADRLYRYSDKKILVMAPTRPLVIQHKNTFMKMLRISEEDVVVLTGKTEQHYRSAVWSSNAKIFFATPQVVKNDLVNNILALSDYSLLVFDEAHRAVKEYAYTDIARYYVKQCDYPLILAMTASPGAERERIQHVCENLFIEQIEYRSEEDGDVRPYVNPISIEWRWVALPESYNKAASVIRDMLNERIVWLIKRNIIRKDPRYVYKKDLINAGEELRYSIEMSMEEERGPLFVSLMNNSVALSLFHSLELLESQGAYSLLAFMEKMEEDNSKSHKMLLSDARVEKLKSILSIADEHPKMLMLIDMLKQQFRKNKQSRVLVFTQYRDTATHIVEVLKRNGIAASRFVGQAKKMRDEGLTQEQQVQTLEMFRGGEFKVLVATSIAEEGLDIPEVDLVVFYEPIPSEIRYIQRRGRTGRKAAGKVIILSTKDSIDARYLYASQKRVQAMKAIVSTLNAKLKSLPRRKEFAANIIDIDSLPSRPEAPAMSMEEQEAVEIKRREVDRVARKLYKEVAKSGMKGIDVYSLEMDEQLVEAACDKLEELRQIVWIDDHTIALRKDFVPVEGKVYSVSVERVMQGSAVVRVNDKWYARMNAEDFDGPRVLVKKGSEFRCVGMLYRQDGKLNIRVRKIVESVR